MAARLANEAMEQALAEGATETQIEATTQSAAETWNAAGGSNTPMPYSRPHAALDFTTKRMHNLQKENKIVANVAGGHHCGPGTYQPRRNQRSNGSITKRQHQPTGAMERMDPITPMNWLGCGYNARPGP